MAVNNDPIFGKTPLSQTVAISTANANRDGTTGTYGTLYTAPTAGAIILGISIKATVTTSAGLVRIFINNGLVWEEPITAITASATQFAWQGWVGRKWQLNGGDVVTCNTEKAENFVLTLFGYAYE